MLLARLLARADFGVAATFGMVLTILEFSSKMAIGRFLVQDKEGDSPRFMATAHTVQLVGGLAGAMLILLAAAPLAALFGLKGDARPFQLLALLPLLKGLEHLDVCRMEREFRYFPSTISTAAPQLLITLMAWPMAVWLPDYRAVLALLVLKAICTTITSHLMAGRSYELGLDREIAFRVLRFGWPLVANGFLMFGVFQGDQFIVASYYSMTDLAAFAAAGALATVPSFIFARIFPSLMLPLMAKIQDDAPQFRERYRMVVEGVCGFAVLYGVTLILGAEAFMRIAFGSQYCGTGHLLAWLAVANALRIIRFAPSVAALAKADSQNQMYSNFWRVSVLLLALVLAQAKQPVWMIAAMGAAGEVLASAVSFIRLSRRDSVPWTWSLFPASLGMLMIGFAGLAAWLGFHRLNPVIVLTVAVLSGVLCSLLHITAMPESRRQAWKVVDELRTGNWRLWFP
jgi:O-antigen/teichoic acid export membrane protein